MRTFTPVLIYKKGKFLQPLQNAGFERHFAGFSGITGLCRNCRTVARLRGNCDGEHRKAGIVRTPRMLRQQIDPDGKKKVIIPKIKPSSTRDLDGKNMNSINKPPVKDLLGAAHQKEQP